MVFDIEKGKRNQRKITRYLKKRYKMEGGRIKKEGRDFLIKSSRIGEELGMSSYEVSKSMPVLAEEGLIEDSELSKGAILWRTCFGRKNKCRKKN